MGGWARFARGSRLWVAFSGKGVACDGQRVVLTQIFYPEIMHIILGVCVKKIRAGVNFHKSVPRFFITLFLA